VAADPSKPPEISEEAVEALAASGAICERCGGLHQVSLDQVIGWLATQEKTGVTIPWCSCGESCPTCQPFLSRIGPTIQNLQNRGEQT
jgi:hypothetical protein